MFMTNKCIDHYFLRVLYIRLKLPAINTFNLFNKLNFEKCVLNFNFFRFTEYTIYSVLIMEIGSYKSKKINEFLQIHMIKPLFYWEPLAMV